jgi:hypothetical protein
MTLQELQQQLADLRAKLANADVDEAQQIDLEITEKQIQMQIIVGTFDPLKTLDGLGGVDLSKIEQLIPQVDQVIKNEIARAKLVTQVISIAKTALRAAGLPIS